MKTIILCLILFFSLSSIAQERYYFIQFKDKDTSKYKLSNPINYISNKSIERRKKYGISITLQDVPININYVNKICSLGFVWHGVSKWLNGISIIANKDSINKLSNLLFIKNIKEIGRVFYENTDNKKAEEFDLNERVNMLESKFDKNIYDTNYYGKSFKQINLINLKALHTKGLQGENILIAVLDAGFESAKNQSTLKNLFNDNRVISTWDFIEKNEDVYHNNQHGLAVLSCMAANKKNVLVGTAPKALYMLLRTEDAEHEYPIEEYNWVAAAEYADSAGADIINSSLGYTKFDGSEYGHKYKELDGKTTIITQAANWAVEKGITLLNSAGNEGNNLWQNIAAPADAEKILCIGASDEAGLYANFSSIGLTADKRQKPDIAAMGQDVYVISSKGNIYEGNGTSYSCPIMAGAAACLLQSNIMQSPAKLKQNILLSANQYYNADKYIGYGIPDFGLAYLFSKNYNKDTLLDVRVLNKNQLHVALHIANVQKIEMSIHAPIENIIWHDTQKFKQIGNARFGIKYYKKLKNGVYVLKIKTQDGIFQKEFIKE